MKPLHMRRTARRLRVPALACALALVIAAAGCSTPPSQFYKLSANPGPAAPASNRSVAVNTVAIPASVDRPQIVVAASPNQMRLDELNRWVSPLQDNIARVVAENLVAMLGTPRVTVSPQMLTVDVDYRVFVEVQTFESAPGQMATLDAVWRVVRVKDGGSRTGRTTVREPTPQPGFDALAAAHSRAIAQMSRDIADAVGALDRP